MLTKTTQKIAVTDSLFCTAIEELIRETPDKTVNIFIHIGIKFTL
jgi:hypothetical protein